MRNRSLVNFVRYAVAGSAAIGSMRAASADLTVVSEVKVTGVPAAKTPLAPNAPGGAATTASGSGAPSAAAAPISTEVDHTYITYFKGNKARRETGNSNVFVLYDREANKVYTVDKSAKTYFVRSFDDAMDNGAGLPDAIAERAELSTSVDLDDAKGDPDAKRTVAGIDATKLSFFGSVTATPKAAEGGGRGGGGGFGGRRGGGGGFPGGGGGNGGGPRGQSVHYAHVTVSGSLWITDALSLLPNGKKDEKELSIALLQQELPDANPLLKPFAKEMASKKVIPVASRFSLRTYSANGQATAYDQGSNSSLSVPDTTEPLVVEMVVSSVDSKSPLDDDLFKLPTGYDRIDPPATISPLPPG